ncbi:S1 RNA-binding domain-containing protein 1 [Fasciola gigantica]|uniref:S1 RNA-binding domain-containing protein 1 n=1 Tax=Fasciola gigantica TaxID=46835 RepID=A0A504Y526_FASGI|nr:S1 RNA-binding domain-containing protein 1 [Fasciola gigantica]
MIKKECRVIDMIDLTGEVADAVHVDPALTSRVISMFEEGYTVPFIARYRKELTGGMEPQVLHRLREKMMECKILIEKIDKSFDYLKKNGLLTDGLSKQLLKCKTVNEVHFITEPLKSKGPRTLSAKAKAANLEALALELLTSGRFVDIARRAPPEARKTFQTEEALRQAVSHIIADVFAKDLDLIRKAEQLCLDLPPMIQTTKRRTKLGDAKPEQTKVNKMDWDNVSESSRSNSTNEHKPHTGCPKKDDLTTFKMYLNFSRTLTSLHAHQILAINRAAERGVISIKISTHNQVEHQIRQFMVEKYFGSVNRAHWDFVHNCFADSWKRLIEPHLTRTLRSKMTIKAQDISLDVFTDNFRRLLMTAPLRVPTGSSTNTSIGDVISSISGAPGDRLPVVGLDPGWVHGCKWAACDPHGVVLATGIVWPPIGTVQPQRHGGRRFVSPKRCFDHKPSYSRRDDGVTHLTAIMRTHSIQTIALGNGQASRETGMWLSELISSGHFKPLVVRYAVVPEAGASVYSASALACAELPGLDVSMRGAVSIARRLQDPLAEWVKMDPKHLGVGMYQHDLPERRLVAAVNAVMEECISFVGVDLNAAPVHILARVAGLSETKAKAIVEYRSRVGSFNTRADLCQVKGIGPTTYAQCAGFIRVRPTVSSVSMDASKDVDMISISSDDDGEVFNTGLGRPGAKRKRALATSVQSKRKRARSQRDPILDPSTFNPLDQTAVHPDTYDVATAIISHLNFSLTDVGSSKLRAAASKLLHTQNREFYGLVLLN